ncbi:DUF1648 domain-containing protein [Isoptericola sediminis]|uniref:DUF1648 domain-containing protein n=1 Tax=Isoptericola sediminis TaxID=2733572 RepID=A0A849K5A8_9MICO|nr:DUF1648 domain-containing protein [Isoptericola sediminis]NNU28081.1 DUF1648 domain-containing protein [Isoptericola sediminis]
MTTPLDTVRTDWHGRARRSTLWSSVAGLGLTLTAAAVVRSWRDDLPARVATHWGPDGTPDATMTVTGLVTAVLALTVGLLALFAVVGLVWGSSASTRRMAAGSAVWSGGLGATLLLVGAGAQRGLDDASSATLSGWAVAATILLPLVPAVVAALVVPGDARQPADAPVPPEAARARLGTDERAAWLRTAQGGTGLAVGAAAVVGTTVLAVLTRQWPLLLVPAVLTLLFAAMFAFRVRVDATGLTARSVLGWPGTHVPADEVVAASVVHVDPFREFGGWGWRVGFRGGRIGIVLRAGEALLVERTGERSLVVTVDDAATGAALLNTLADRSRQNRTPH